MSIATRTGDHGKTSLMYGKRVSKTDARVETYGTVDELNSALGLARATSQLPYVQEILLATQKNLVALMGELAVADEDAEKYASSQYPRLNESMLDALDQAVTEIEAQNITFDGWATPGDSIGSAALDVARTVCRRAERLVVALQEANRPVNPLAIKYLNRLSDVLWLLARYTETKN